MGHKGVKIIQACFHDGDLGLHGSEPDVHDRCTIELIVCVDVLQPSQPNGVISSMVSLPNHTFTGQT